MLMACSVSARPEQSIPLIDESALKSYAISHQDISSDKYAYRIYIATPLQLSQPAPVLYMLDGNGQFPRAVNLAAKEIVNNELPIIIGIGYQLDVAYPTLERTRDYTPKVNGEAFQQGGGSEDFYQFIHSTLKPWAENHLPIDNQQQTLFGHSLGGVFTLMVLQQHPESFQRYVAASPSLWWGKGEMIDLDKLTQSAQDKVIYVTLGGLEEKPDLSQLSPEQLKNYQSRSSWINSRELCEHISQSAQSCTFLLFADKSHGSVIPDALHTALQVATSNIE
nr:alpha/beta fold hydrolase [uncultured Moellerella sp.]